MKKTLFLLVAICCYVSANAQNIGDEFSNSSGTYRITSTNPAEVKLIKVNKGLSTGGTYGEVTSQDQTYAITSINSDAFRDFSNANAKFKFTKLTHFDSNAFYNCKCYSIDMSSSPLTSLPKSAFYKCNCPNFTLPSSITTIPEKAFQASGVKDISMQNITRIEGSAFYNCSDLKSINLTNVTYIGATAFYECTGLTDVTLPQSLETIGGSAFAFCYLNTLTLYNTVQTVLSDKHIMADNGTITMNIVNWSNKNALSGNDNITQTITYKYNDTAITGEYTLPDNITTLGEGALYHCTDVTNIKMPASLILIGAKALAKCTNLASITCNATTAPEVTNANAFSEVDKNISVNIPNNDYTYYSYTHTTGWKDFTNYAVTIETIKGAAILDLNYTAGSNPSQAVIDIVTDYTARINNATEKGEIENLTQEGIKAIIDQITKDRGMVKIDNLYYILNNETHTATVTYGGLEAEGYATTEYKGSITLPESVTYNDATYSVSAIGEHAFQNCNGLTSINVPLTVLDIADYAFYSCKGLKTVLLPTILNSIGDFSFFDCSAITSITYLASSLPCSLGKDTFVGVDKAIPVTVLEAQLKTFQDAKWGGFTNFVTNPSLDNAKANAKQAIINEMNPYQFVNYIANLALNFCLRIEGATTVDDVNALGTEGLSAISYSIAAYKGFFGEMGEINYESPVVVVRGKDNKVITLYYPEKVEFQKDSTGN